MITNYSTCLKFNNNKAIVKKNQQFYQKIIETTYTLTTRFGEITQFGKNILFLRLLKVMNKCYLNMTRDRCKLM